jgi:hypothetical protein
MNCIIENVSINLSPNNVTDLSFQNNIIIPNSQSSIPVLINEEKYNTTPPPILTPIQHHSTTTNG